MSNDPASERVLILDFGGQYTQLIARRVRESGVYCEIWPASAAPERLDHSGAAAFILSGGPASVTDQAAPSVPPGVFAAGVPVLGICYGQQTMCAALGGTVEPAERREFGRAVVTVEAECDLFRGVWRQGTCAPVWMSHGDRVTGLPPGFRAVAVSDGAPFAAIADDTRRFYGVQFHPEVVHTLDGPRLLRNFTHHIAGCSGNWSMAAFRDRAIARIRDQVGDGWVICGLSGGVDSAVAAVLIHQAIGERLTAIFVDHGLLRTGEADQVVATFRDRFNIRLVHREAAGLFLAALTGRTDPEVKRKTIGRLFIAVFEDEARKLGGADYLAQGTLYPDVIESGGVAGTASTIKSHHNVGGLPERMGLKLVEPLRELFKDEVRALGRELGMPAAILGRHPFPGPGLAIRLPGEVTPERLMVLRRADAIFLEELRTAALYDAIWQAFAVLLPEPGGTGQLCVLRAVTSTDGMTADTYAFEPAFLGRVAERIVTEVPGISRVAYDLTSKPPGTIEWE